MYVDVDGDACLLSELRFYGHGSLIVNLFKYPFFFIAHRENDLIR